jgi:hypothetical protein
LPVCEGCGTRTDEAHIARRATRLDLASRMRPARIRVLLLDGAPPARIENYFYRPALNPADRSLGARRYFEELMKAAGVPVAVGSQEATLLAEFQQKGFFLTYAVECPFEEQDDPKGALRRGFDPALRNDWMGRPLGSREWFAVYRFLRRRSSQKRERRQVARRTH